MSIVDKLKVRYQTANIVEQIIYINLGVFIAVFLVNTLGFLFNSQTNFFIEWFAMPAGIDSFLTRPWTIISYGFLHTGFLHILFNLILLYYIGNIFIQYFTSKQLVTFYLLGTFFGGLVYLLSYNFFPAFVKDVDRSVLLGASAGISAIFVGIATYMPNYQLKLRFIGYVKLWHLAAIFVGLDVVQIPLGNAGGHLAHLGGALFGFIYVNQASSKKINFLESIFSIFQTKKKPMRTVYKSENKNPKAAKTKSSTTKNQKEIDAILDKISKSGYDALTKSEKEFLFKQGK